MPLCFHLEIHPLIKAISKRTVLSALFAAMRLTFCEGTPRSFGFDTAGGLYGKNDGPSDERELENGNGVKLFCIFFLLLSPNPPNQKH